jgi:hypothetical protein
MTYLTFFLLLSLKESLHTPISSAFYRKDGVRLNFFISGRIFRLLWTSGRKKPLQGVGNTGLLAHFAAVYILGVSMSSV